MDVYIHFDMVSFEFGLNKRPKILQLDALFNSYNGIKLLGKRMR